MSDRADQSFWGRLYQAMWTCSEMIAVRFVTEAAAMATFPTGSNKLVDAFKKYRPQIIGSLRLGTSGVILYHLLEQISKTQEKLRSAQEDNKRVSVKMQSVMCNRTLSLTCLSSRIDE
jgi:hypothetical protein